jgi:tRNA modification GTPase
LWVIDGSLPPDDWEALANELRGRKVIIVCNKNDLPPNRAAAAAISRIEKWPHISVSTMDPECGEKVRQFMECRLRELDIFPDSIGIVTTHRQAELLHEALGAAGRAEEYLRDNVVELMAEELRHSLSALQAIIGKGVDDTMLNRLFEKFCIGK